MNNTFKVKTKVFLWSRDAAGAWHFAVIPETISGEIKFLFRHLKKGWGSLQVKVAIGETQWETSIFPDKKRNAYLLPLKASVRKAEDIKEGDTIELTLKIKED